MQHYQLFSNTTRCYDAYEYTFGGMNEGIKIQHGWAHRNVARSFYLLNCRKVQAGLDN